MSEQICVSPHASRVKALRERLVQLRKAADISQSELGRRMNPDSPILKQEIFRIESGEALLTFEKLSMISDAYDIKTSELVDLDKDIDKILKKAHPR